jgi:hypothetical protein
MSTSGGGAGHVAWATTLMYSGFVTNAWRNETNQLYDEAVLNWAAIWVKDRCLGHNFAPLRLNWAWINEVNLVITITYVPRLELTLVVIKY